jgi:hypothetical protein
MLILCSQLSYRVRTPPRTHGTIPCERFRPDDLPRVFHWSLLLYVPLLLYQVCSSFGPLLLHRIARRPLQCVPTFATKYGHRFSFARSVAAPPRESRMPRSTHRPAPSPGRIVHGSGSMIFGEGNLSIIFVGVAYGVKICYAFAYNYVFMRVFIVRLFLISARIRHVSYLITCPVIHI